MSEDLGVIGLALSGGGSRAIAFHLGCLRTLNKLGILKQVAVISTISGGSVIGAAYKAHDGTFEEFDAKMQDILRRGLARSMARQFLSLLGLKIILAFAITAVFAVAWSIIRFTALFLSFFAPIKVGFLNKLRESRSPLPRFASRTSLLEGALNQLIFRDLQLDQLSAAAPSLVVNATELRTGSAFRFSRTESGSWRLGRLTKNDLPLAHAVAASAAYPLFLPAFDEIREFEKKGNFRPHRINLTDGGVYDNLGLSNFWPGRSTAISLNVVNVDTIVCCSAGYGLRQEPPSQFILARMSSAINVTFDRAQNASIARLYELKAAGKIKNFIIPYLGQRDDQLIGAPADLVRREEAHIYPTNFNAMPEEWIERLGRRGEQLTQLAAETYLGFRNTAPGEGAAGCVKG